MHTVELMDQLLFIDETWLIVFMGKHLYGIYCGSDVEALDFLRLPADWCIGGCL